MKKILLFCIFMIGAFLLIGCGKYGEKDLIKDLNSKINESKAYSLSGELEITNNEENYLYNVDVSFKKDNNFRVSLINKTNNHEQIILRNTTGVYVLTPSLNKSFKFQSEWPYNNSQSYLLQTLMNDINNDKDKIFEEKDGNYIITTKVNYSNNDDLVKQRIYIDKSANINKVEVIDKSDIPKIKMSFNNIDLNPTFDENYFEIDNSINSSNNLEKDVPVTKIDDIIFPMYVPADTYLSSQDKIYLNEGERVILNFAGAKPFTLVQETIKRGSGTVIPTAGEIQRVLDTVGYISDSSISWDSNGVEYFVSSPILTRQELLQVANSMGVMPVGK